MKFLILALFISLNASAQDNTLEDLGSIDLSIPEASTPLLTIAYPGLGHEDRQTDCMVLDVRHRKVTLKQKMQIAKKLRVVDGYYLSTGDQRTELRPSVTPGPKVVFNLVSGGSYLTNIQVSARGGETLQEALTSVPGINEGHRVALVYVRGCRF